MHSSSSLPNSRRNPKCGNQSTRGSGTTVVEIGLPRIGVEAVADQWETHDIQVNVAFADGRVFNIFGPGPIHDPSGADGKSRVLGAGPLSFELVEPFRHLRLRVDGEGTESSAKAQIEGAPPGQGATVPIHLEVDIRPAVPPWTNGALLADAKRVLDTQEEGDLMGHPWRFEQLSRATGTLRVGDETYEINGGANRIRRQSIRRVAKLRGHAWQAGAVPEWPRVRLYRVPTPRRRQGHVQRGLHLRR